MKKIICFLTLLTLNLNHSVFATESGLDPSKIETSFDAVPRGKAFVSSSSGRDLTVVGKRRTPLLKFQPIVLHLHSRYEDTLRTAEALIDAAMRENAPVTFFVVVKVSAPFTSEFNVHKISFDGITVNIEGGVVETKESKQSTVLPTSTTAETKVTRFATVGREIEIRTPEASEPPSFLDDYTVELDARFGVQNTVNGLWLYIGTKNLEVKRAVVDGRIIKLTVQSANRTAHLGERISEIDLTFNREIDPARIWVMSLEPSQLNGAVAVLTKNVRAGKANAPMLERLLASASQPTTK